MGLVFAIEILAIVILFVLINFHLARKRIAESVHHGHGEKDAVIRAMHAHNMCMGYSSMGVAIILYLWIQGIHPVFSIIYGGVLFLGCLIYTYAVLCHEVRCKNDYSVRKLGGFLALAAIVAASVTAFVILL